MNKLFEPIGYIVALTTLIFSWIFFYFENRVLLDSFFAALLAAGLFWITYIMLRLLWFTFKKK